MRKILFFIPLFVYGEFSKYQEQYSNIIFLLDNPLLSSGKYEKEDLEIKNYSIGVDEYYLIDGKYRPFILGSIGYSKYEDNSFEDNSFFAKIGGGVNIVASKEVSNSFGVTYSKLFTPNISKATLYYKFNYKTTYHDLKPYLNLKSSYSYIDYSKADEVKGVDIELKLGAIKDEAFRVWQLPVSVEGYTQLIVVDDKLAKVNEFDALYSAGVIFGLKVGQKLKSDYLKNLKLNLTLQGSKSNKDLKGYKVGVGVSLLKF